MRSIPIVMQSRLALAAAFAASLLALQVPERVLAASPAATRGEALIQQGQLQAAWNTVIGPAEAGDAHAQFVAGMVLANQGRWDGARAWWLKGSAAGDGDAATALGYAALGGRGGEPRSAANAARHFEDGARHGSAQGMLNLARLLLIGDGTPVDRARAAKLRQQAAAAKEPTALALVRGTGNRDSAAVVDAAAWLGNFDRARDGIALLTREGNAGNVDAMVVLGKAYYNGQTGDGRGRNYAQARYWWEKAGAQPAALYYLGMLYMYGRGVHSNWGRAESYFADAARHGHPDGSRMAAAMRDLHIDLDAVRAGYEFNERRCGSEGGVAIGMSCSVQGYLIW